MIISRWQVRIATVFHFIFVPLTIGHALILAIMQTAAYRSRNDAT
jgi:cytochrome d ubiquinol oxidase subunit I